MTAAQLLAKAQQYAALDLDWMQLAVGTLTVANVLDEMNQAIRDISRMIQWREAAIPVTLTAGVATYSLENASVWSNRTLFEINRFEVNGYPLLSARDGSSALTPYEYFRSVQPNYEQATAGAPIYAVSWPGTKVLLHPAPSNAWLTTVPAPIVRVDAYCTPPLVVDANTVIDLPADLDAALARQLVVLSAEAIATEDSARIRIGAYRAAIEQKCSEWLRANEGAVDGRESRWHENILGGYL